MRETRLDAHLRELQQAVDASDTDALMPSETRDVAETSEGPH